jgi:hypothetical protein
MWDDGKAGTGYFVSVVLDVEKNNLSPVFALPAFGHLPRKCRMNQKKTPVAQATGASWYVLLLLQEVVESATISSRAQAL